MTDTKTKPQVLVLGGNFAGLGAAQKIRQYAGDSVDITVMDLRDYLLFVPNIPSDVMENRNPELRERMQLRPVLALGAHLAYDRIEGFAEHGHTVSDLFHGKKLREYLFDGGYKGGPIAIGAAHFHQSDGADGLEPYPGGSIPHARAACEGPVLEMSTALASYLTHEANEPLQPVVFCIGDMGQGKAFYVRAST